MRRCALSYQRQSREFAPTDPTPVATDSVMLVRQAPVANLPSAPLFRLSPEAQRQHAQRTWGSRRRCASGSSYAQARLVAPAPGKLARGFSRQSLRRAPLSDVLQGLHREGVGRALHGNHRRVGRTADQGIVGEQRRSRMRSPHPFAPRRIPAQTHTETSLIERFLYPKFGPGQMWEEVAREVTARGGEVHLRHRVVGIERSGSRDRRHGPR